MAVNSNEFLPGRRLAKSVWVVSLVASVALLSLPFLFKLDGKPHADWQQFLGRFHPLIVHLPIGLILLVPLLEIAGIFRPALREAAAFVLSLSVFACLAAVSLGYLLAYGSGDTGAGVTRHMWGGIFLTIAVLFCALLRHVLAAGRFRGAQRAAYPLMLVGVLLVLSWAAHLGGSLTHGENYLFEYLPGPIKRWTGFHKTQAQIVPVSDSFYAKHINPILDANCATCHSEAKVKGGLRVDTYDLLMRGGQEGSVIVPGQPDRSLLLQRITLPTDHKQFMPADGKPPVKPEDIALLKAWILQGASPTVNSLAGIAITEPLKESAPPPVGDYSAMMAAIAHTAKAENVTLWQVSKNPADGLILNTINASPGFSDAQLVKFEKFAPYIVEIELGRTSVTDASFDTLVKFSNLRALHLEGTSITGEGLAKLAPLVQLNYLNLSGTKVTEAAAAPLTAMKQLHHLYLYNTPAQPLAAAPAEPPPVRKTT